MSGKLLLIHGTVTEVSSQDYFHAHERIRELEEALKSVLPYLPSIEQTETIYRALRMERPPLRKLKGKVPRYQRNL